MSDRWNQSDVPRGDAYDRRFERLAEQGVDVHGEVALVAAYEPTVVLDAGCGTGRVAIELAARGHDVVGVDVDAHMLDAARRKAPHIRWIRGDLADPQLDVGRTFDVVVMAGNVLIFVEPGTEGAVITNAARWLSRGGRLVAGYSIRPGSDAFGPDAHDRLADEAGLELEDRWSTWDRAPFTQPAHYAVSVHRLRA